MEAPSLGCFLTVTELRARQRLRYLVWQDPVIFPDGIGNVQKSPLQWAACLLQTFVEGG